jgi:hypothetical protein
MPEVIETTVYKFEELDERAKERARDWYRESSDESDLEGTIEDFTRICDIIGITLATEPVKLMGGGTRYDPKLAYSVGFSQSDFAGYDGRYSYAKGAAKKIREYAPQDTTLHAIVDGLQALQKPHVYSLTATMSYHHYYGQQVEVEDSRDREVSSEAYQAAKELFKDLARWLYDSLRKEVEYQNSEEVVDENIMCNDYTFTASGRRFG